MINRGQVQIKSSGDYSGKYKEGQVFEIVRCFKAHRVDGKESSCDICLLNSIEFWICPDGAKRCDACLSKFKPV